jgi:DNA-binding transcriptional ArsR family regulator
MACLGEGSRFRLVRALIGGARCVTDLAGEVGLSQSCTTRHLQALERRRVVTGTRDGKRVLYRIRDDEPALVPLLEWALDSGREKAAPGSGGGPTADAADGPGVSPGGKRAPKSARRPPTAAVPIEAPVPASGLASEPVTGPPSVSEPAPEPARRRRSSEIEDFLL